MMKKGNFKSNFLFIVGISIIVIVLFIVGFVVFYEDSSFIFNNDGYIISATENSSDSYSFANGTKYKSNLNNDIAFEDTNKKSVAVDSACFVHYQDGSLSFLQNGALLDLDKVNDDYVPYYNISNKFIINYSNGIYSITNDTKSLSFSNWIGRISDSKYIVVGKNLSLKIPGVNKSIEGDYFEFLFMTDGVVKIDNQDVSYQVTAQGSTVYVGDNVRIDLGEGQIFYNGESKMLLSQITISGDENISFDEGNGGSGGGDGSGITSGITSGSSSGGSGVTFGVTSGVTSGATSGVTSGATSGITSGDGSGGAGGGASGSGSGDGSSEGGGNGGVQTTASATIELIKLDVTAISMNATLQMNRSSLIEGALSAYLTNIATGQRESIDISKVDGTLAICSSGVNCYSFGTTLLPDSQYLLSIVDVSNSKQYFQKLITTSELGVSLEKLYATSNSLTYNIQYDVSIDEDGEENKKNVSRVDFYLYDDSGSEVYREIGITDTKSVTKSGLKPYSTYKAVVKNVSVCDSEGNCNFDDEYEIARSDMTLKATPFIQAIGVKKNVDSATFDLSATVVDDYSTVTKYIYTVCKEVTEDEEEEVDPECFTREKTDGDALSIKVGDDIVSGVTYIYTFKVQYNDGQMERQVSYNGSSLFSMESLPYFQITEKEVTSNSIYAKLSLVDPSCTVPMSGRICKGKPEMNSNNTFTLRYYKLTDGENYAKELTLNRDNFKYDSDSGLYYFDLNLSNLASETKYVIKVLGTYYLNGEERKGAQIGDELYIDTAATGNLKFVYSHSNSGGSDGSDDTMVINYNAKLSGGSNDDENLDDESKENESLSALNSIHLLSFDLYAGTYADDSETNNRHIGKTYNIKGNSNIKIAFCGSVDSNDCDISQNFNNTMFGIPDLDVLMSETASLNNFCIAESFGCLATSYTIVVKGYDKAGNSINIDNDTYVYKITPSYYVTKQLDYHKNVNSIVVDPIFKGDFKVDDGYNFDEVFDSVGDTLKNKNNYEDNLKVIDDSTVVGVEIFASIPQSYIDSVYDYDKVVTNYYICDSELDDCNKDTALVTKSLENINYTDTSQIFYLNDSNFVRGKTYKIMYELLFTDTEGIVSKYSNNYTIINNYDIERQAPIYNFYILESTKNTIKYSYNIKDVDGAIDKNDYYFYYSVGNGQTVKGSAYKLNTIAYVTFDICEDTCNGYRYNIYLKEKLIGDTGDYVAIAEDVFDGEYAESEEDNFELLTFDSDNRLYIKLNDDELGSRTALYHVLLSDRDGSKIYDKYYISSKLDKCISNSENKENDNIVCSINQRNYNDFKYITVDFANENIAKKMGEKISVFVESYYDSGLVGINQIFSNGLLLQNGAFNDGVYQKKYLNVYYSSGVNSSVGADVIYKVSQGSWAFGNDNAIYLYNMLDLKKVSDYDNMSGADYYTGSGDSVHREFVLYPLTSKVGFKLNNYSNYNPKVVSISKLKTDDNTFKFDSIIPKVGVVENPGINSLELDFELDGVITSDLSKQFKKENGKYYLYINLYNENDEIVKENVKAEIKEENGVARANIFFLDLNVESSYKYKIYAYMKNTNSSSGYSFVQMYDMNCETCQKNYVKTTYETSTLLKDNLLDKVVFIAKPFGYGNFGESISKKQIVYNVKVKNGAKMKVRLELYDRENNLVNFDGTKCKDNSCYVEISDSSKVLSNSIVSLSDEKLNFDFNGNNYVFGDDYYTLKVYGIPYYTDGGYVTNVEDMLLLYDSKLNTKNQGKEEIDVGELNQPIFNVSNPKSECTGSGASVKCSINFRIFSIKDDDFVMKNGEYYINLYDSDGNIVYTVKNQNGKAYLIKSGSSSGTPLSGGAKLDVKSTVDIEFQNLKSNTQYSIELAYDTYRNNVSFFEDEGKKREVSPYIDYIYTPISAGITLGDVNVSKESNTSFKLLYDGATNINDIKRVDYRVTLKGSSNSASGEFVAKSNSAIFTVSNGVYYLLFDLKNSNNAKFNFSTVGTYNISVTYYTDTAGKEKIHSSTHSIIVQ